MNYVVALVAGVAFGLALNKAGLTKYNKIVGVFRFTDMAVLKFMMTALAVARGLEELPRPREHLHIARRKPFAVGPQGIRDRDRLRAGEGDKLGNVGDAQH